MTIIIIIVTIVNLAWHDSHQMAWGPLDLQESIYTWLHLETMLAMHKLHNSGDTRERLLTY